MKIKSQMSGFIPLKLSMDLKGQISEKCSGKQIYNFLSEAVSSLWTKLEPVLDTDSLVFLALFYVSVVERRESETAIPSSHVPALIKLPSEESEKITEESSGFDIRPPP
ncbi:hypothetical protein DAPPUDRAFT_245236 [Daphnia pulex]|uniref:Uncharacterized protein n=1 Tax=Daphnia pulex TaxID=6669 RepID=E9GMU4_DAPPU|nr:hypothetical protein DAPPUDRAFT_269456 [Daphnia pulex]EFX79154.1 hypothetical protein DAPPUDRAFT_245231 [Daphnia pulex]EFX79156.1 hypothetical protein DAPPUDRAFT_245236 [Daphnia pulex]|eukprot:EFX62909.1 hypothetical protein DAPPUDRAFT_269456 [Daphnia pulex]